MTVLHGLVAHARGGLAGLQTSQRDWSPFLAHFASHAAMRPLRRALADERSPEEVKGLLEDADAASFHIIEQIVNSGELRASSPSPQHAAPACVCMSECSLPGLLGHCERYGRFGLIFRKDTIAALGGSPCVYVSDEVYDLIAREGRDRLDGPQVELLGLANRYRPPGLGGKIQDYTHEREWRVFGDISLEVNQPEIVVTPTAYAKQARAMFAAETHVIPIDTLHEWGL